MLLRVVLHPACQGCAMRRAGYGAAVRCAQTQPACRRNKDSPLSAAPVHAGASAAIGLRPGADLPSAAALPPPKIGRISRADAGSAIRHRPASAERRRYLAVWVAIRYVTEMDLCGFSRGRLCHIVGHATYPGLDLDVLFRPAQPALQVHLCRLRGIAQQIFSNSPGLLQQISVALQIGYPQ